MRGRLAGRGGPGLGDLRGFWYAWQGLRVVDLLGGALSGAGCGPMTEEVGNGLFIQLTDPACFCAREEFLDHVERFTEYLKSSPLKEGVEEILLPGEPEQRTAALRREQSLEIDDPTWGQLLELSKELGVEAPGDS